MQQLTGHVKGELLVGASTTIGEYILPYVLGEFKHEYPDVNVTIQILNTKDVVQAVLNRTFDIGIVEGLISAVPSQLTAQQFLEDELVVAVPADHPLASRKTVSLDEIQDLPFITREPGSGTRLVFEQALIDADFDIENMNIIMELGSTTAIKSAILGGLGISVISKWAVQDQIKTGKLVALNLEGITMKRDFTIIMNTEKFQSEACSKFAEFLDINKVISILQNV